MAPLGAPFAAGGAPRRPPGAGAPYQPRGLYPIGASRMYPAASARSIAFGRIIVVCVPPIPCSVTIIGAFLFVFTFDDTNNAYGMSSLVSAK